MRGTLLLPEGEGPHPAVVWVHGSGRATRDQAGSWRYFFVERGFAVLSVDKRGVGRSDGHYEMPDGGHDNLPHMQRRSGDVLSEVLALAERDDIDSERIGLVGASQAGWVIPMASGTGDVAFAIVLSGGATNVSIEGRFSSLAAEGESSADAAQVDELIEQLRSYEPRDPDFVAEFAGMECPGLWLYGAKDRSNPSRLCAELIEEIAAAEGKDFTVRMFRRATTR